MATDGAFLSPRYVFVIDGQSLPQYPTAAFRDALATGLSILSPCPLVCVNGMPWSALTNSKANRWAPYLSTAATLVLLMCGGTSDIWSGTSGADLYALEWAYADAARTAGFDYVFNTTLCGNVTNTGPQETQRVNRNVAVLADASNKFDGVADLAADPALDNYADTTYFQGDGIHWKTAGAQAAAAVCVPVIESIFP